MVQISMFGIESIFRVRAPGTAPCSSDSEHSNSDVHGARWKNLPRPFARNFSRLVMHGGQPSPDPRWTFSNRLSCQPPNIARGESTHWIPLRTDRMGTPQEPELKRVECGTVRQSGEAKSSDRRRPPRSSCPLPPCSVATLWPLTSTLSGEAMRHLPHNPHDKATFSLWQHRTRPIDEPRFRHLSVRADRGCCDRVDNTNAASAMQPLQDEPVTGAVPTPTSSAERQIPYRGHDEPSDMILRRSAARRLLVRRCPLFPSLHVSTSEGTLGSRLSCRSPEPAQRIPGKKQPLIGHRSECARLAVEVVPIHTIGRCR